VVEHGVEHAVALAAHVVPVGGVEGGGVGHARVSGTCR
jgi:hypothetical protein